MLGEGRPRHRRSPVEHGGAVERREQPLVRVDHEAVGQLDAGEARPGAGRHHRSAPVGAVDVEPQASLTGHRAGARQVVDDARVGGAGGGHHGHGPGLVGAVERRPHRGRALRR